MREISNSNIKDERESKECVVAYQETNAMFVKLNEYLIKNRGLGYRDATS